MEGGIMTTMISNVYSRRYRQLVREFPLRELRTKKDAQAATDILDQLFRDHYDDEGEAAYVFVLARLLEDYENKYDPTPDTASGLDVLRHLVEENGIIQSELARILGIGQSAVSMLLNGERPITAEHARRLGRRFGVNPGAFL
jgi:HTH-type transcriptional regulator / antitoxin HigA